MARKLLYTLFVLVIARTSTAQLELDRVSFKGFNAIGFGGFFNVAIPISTADYVTGEVGLSVYSSNENDVILAPILAGYRFTLNRTGDGFYVEPNAGYGFGATDIQIPDASGIYNNAKVAGAATGLTLGYLFQPLGRIQFNLGIRYEHIFGSDLAPNEFSIRIAHAFRFGRRDSSY